MDVLSPTSRRSIKGSKKDSLSFPRRILLVSPHTVVWFNEEVNRSHMSMRVIDSRAGVFTSGYEGKKRTRTENEERRGRKPIFDI